MELGLAGKMPVSYLNCSKDQSNYGCQNLGRGWNNSKCRFTSTLCSLDLGDTCSASGFALLKSTCGFYIPSSLMSHANIYMLLVVFSGRGHLLLENVVLCCRQYPRHLDIVRQWEYS